MNKRRGTESLHFCIYTKVRLRDFVGKGKKKKRLINQIRCWLGEKWRGQF